MGRVSYSRASRRSLGVPSGLNLETASSFCRSFSILNPSHQCSLFRNHCSSSSPFSLIDEGKYLVDGILDPFVTFDSPSGVLFLDIFSEIHSSPSPEASGLLPNNCHWGQGYPETSGNILGTFQGLGQFYCTVTNRHIYGTFEMCC